MHIQPQAYSSQKVVESSSKLQVGSPNTHMFESTITKLSLFLSHTSCTSLIMELLRWFINSTFSGVFKSSLFLISFRFGKHSFLQLFASFHCLGVMATDDDVLFVGVVSISKRHEAHGHSLFAFVFFVNRHFTEIYCVQQISQLRN